MSSGRIAQALFSDPEAEAVFGEEQELALLLLVEAALCRACEAEGLCPQGSAEALQAAVAEPIGLGALLPELKRDGVVVPSLVRLLKSRVAEPLRRGIHLGATSQDIVDTALVLRLLQALSLAEGRLALTLSRFEALHASYSRCSVDAITRMQAAVPIRFEARLATWRRSLHRAQAAAPGLRARVGAVQLGGAVGDRSAWGGVADGVAGRLADALELCDPGHAWHTDRSRLVDFAHWCGDLTASLAKIGTDVGMMALSGVVSLGQAGRSSAMPHKQNPILAELLVAQGHRAQGLLQMMHVAQVHEFERSGAAWTLEQWALPELVTCALGTLNTANRLLSQLRCEASS